MEKKNFTVTAVGKYGLEILNRISGLYLQKNIPVSSLLFTRGENGTGSYRLEVEAPENTMARTILQMKNIVDIKDVNYYTNK
ncbi:MAG: hypothetical protein LKI53_08265 [Bacteroidales bacterium]|jgi:acetolactate synthase small subunit|nr:hypothetical protein [Bacteroidales bacterium]